jgi:hypothetical protein
MVGEVGVLMAAVAAAGVRTAAVAVEEEAHTVVVEADLTGAEVRTEAALTDDKSSSYSPPQKNWGGFFFCRCVYDSRVTTLRQQRCLLAREKRGAFPDWT